MVPKEKGTPFPRHKHREKADGEDDVTEFNASASKIIAPVSFIALFRFATRFELVLNLVGLIAAAGAGAAQPLMTLIFGNFVQAFLDFGASLAEAKAGDATARAQIPGAAAAFRRSMGKDSAALVYIGIAMFFLHFRIHVHTGTYWGGWRKATERTLSRSCSASRYRFIHHSLFSPEVNYSEQPLARAN